MVPMLLRMKVLKNISFVGKEMFLLCQMNQDFSRFQIIVDFYPDI